MNEKKPDQGLTGGRVQIPVLSFSGMREKALFFGWIGGLLLLGGLLWFFTQPVRLRITGAAVNRILNSREYPRRLGDPIPRGQLNRSLISLGNWYTLENLRDRSPAGQALVFSLIAEGGQAPCTAIISPEGKVEELIPLNVHGEWMLKRLPRETLGLYIRRIESPRGILSGKGAE
ncbi:MAG: hypothetical protein LBP43_02505 [Treponema sp.]|jgi:hypothetical protein|nr:hypothetical protein [Treponema sp.]